MYAIIKLSSCLLLVSFGGCQRGKKLAENDPCGTGAQRGLCKTTENCKTAADIIKRGGRPPICGFLGSTALICCQGEVESPLPNSFNGRKSISEQKCEEYGKSVYETTNVGILGAPDENVTLCEWHAQELIVGGEKAKPKVYTHMALIGYGKSEARREWLCGGSLISERFILSAAHCAEVERMKAGWARLGELDLSSETDDARPVDFKIIESFVPKEYKKQTSYHDIALFKLEDNVRFNAFVRPICLHTSLEIESKKRPIVTGWGRLEFKGQFSPDLRQLKVDLVDTQKCTTVFKRFEAKKSLIPQGINGDTMLCAGGVEGQDSCGGDSGGPLQITLTKPFCMFSQIGVVSFGNKCAVGDPGVYTRVSHFVPWIESIVWPSN